MNALSMIFLMIFALVLAGSYLLIRRSLLPIRTAGLLCGAGTISSLIGFGFAQDLGLAHALVVGTVVGLGFTVAAIAMAAFFQNNQPTAEEMELLKAKQSSPK